MSLYPSLEDMQVDKLAKAQVQVTHQQQQSMYPMDFSNAMPMPMQTANTQSVAVMYPTLGDFMGLELSEAMIAENMPEYLSIAVQHTQAVAAPVNSGMIAPLSGNSVGLQRAQVTNGIRELLLCKDKDNKVGVRVKDINKGVFVCLVIAKSPAALAGLRFGDQILQINGVNVAGLNMDKVHDMFKKSPVNGISVVVRDRPFERTLTLHKDSTGHIGFQFRNGKIISLVKDSSAARNGLLTEHHLLEIDGQNVVGLKDKEISKVFEKAEKVVTITVMPSFLYDHMVAKMNNSLIKGLMDHSVPDL